MPWNIYPLIDFKNHSENWNNLNCSGPNTPLLSSNFVIPLLEYFSSSDDKLAIYSNNDSPNAMAIITHPKFGVWQTLQPSQSPLGLWLQDKKTTTGDLLSGLRKSLSFPTILVGITQQDPDLLPRPETRNGLSTLDYIKTARISVNSNFNDYWAKRGKNLRQNLNRQRNRLEREGIKTTLKIITATDKIQQAIIDYGQLESSGWKNTGGTAIHIDNKQGKFYQDMLINFSRNQDTLIFQYYYEEKLVATDLCIKDSRILIILKTTYDETITTSSPAMLMRQEAFEYIFNNLKIERIEFYGKLMDWHTKWSDEIRNMYHINYKAI